MAGRRNATRAVRERRPEVVADEVLQLGGRLADGGEDAERFAPNVDPAFDGPPDGVGAKLSSPPAIYNLELWHIHECPELIHSVEPFRHME
jgi:hypothetical protein